MGECVTVKNIVKGVKQTPSTPEYLAGYFNFSSLGKDHIRTHAQKNK